MLLRFNIVSELDERNWIYTNFEDGRTASRDLIARLLPTLGEHDPVLELGCGSGQLTLPLAQVSSNVTVIEDDTDSVVDVRNKLETAGLSADFISKGNIDVNSSDKFTAVFAMADVITQCKSDKEQSSIIQQIHSILSDDGVAVFGLSDYGNLMEHENRDAISYVRRRKYNGRNFLTFWRRKWNGEPKTTLHEFSCYLVSDDQQAHIKTTTVQRNAISPKRLTQVLRDSGFEEIRWYGTYETGYYQEVCVAYPLRCTIEAQFKSNLVEMDALTYKSRVYIIWDGSEHAMQSIEYELAKPDQQVAIHYTHLIDSEESRNNSQKHLQSIQQQINELRVRVRDFEFSVSGVDLAEFSEQCPRALAQAYLAAQVIMTARLTSKDTIMFLPNNSNDLKVSLEMIKTISRSEEDLPNLQ